MSAHNAAFQDHDIDAAVDPGNAGTITVNRSPHIVGLISTGAETRTLARPRKIGARCLLYMRTDGGDITLTVTGGFNEDGETTFAFSDPDQFIELVATYGSAAGTFQWRKVSDHTIGNLSASVLGVLDALTATAAEINALATANASLSVTAGAGITSGTGTIYKQNIVKVGQLYLTTIYIDLTGLASIATDGDIIGVNGGGAAHIGRVTAALNGTIESMRVTCEEAPAGGLADIDFFRATVATGAQDDAMSGVTGQAVAITAGGNWTNGLVKCATAVPAANDYLYLASGAGSGAGTYTAGKFRIEILGY